MNLEQKNAKKRKNYNCEICAFVSSNKFDYDRHILTRKHINNAKLNQIEPKNAKKRNVILQHVCSQCNKTYHNKSSLWYHKKKCTIVDQENPDESTNTFTPEIFIKILKENKEIQNVLIEQNKQLQDKLLEKDNVLIEQNNKLFELAKNQSITNNTINNTTNNTQFNLNFFLNETCKDAMNITDFVNSLQVQIADLEKTGKIGYVEGISGIFLRGLRELDYTMRPIHCTDLKRETVYVKDENSWEKDDNEKAKLKLAIQRVARKNMRTLPRWQEENPDFRILDTKENDDYLKIALNSMGGQNEEEHEKYIDKIIRNVLKEVVIEKK